MPENVAPIHKEDCPDLGVIVREIYDAYKTKYFKTSYVKVGELIGFSKSGFGRFISGEKRPEDIPADTIIELVRVLKPNADQRIRLIFAYKCHKRQQKLREIRQKEQELLEMDQALAPLLGKDLENYE